MQFSHFHVGFTCSSLKTLQRDKVEFWGNLILVTKFGKIHRMEVQSSEELSARCLLCTRTHCPSSNNLAMAGEIGEEMGGSSLVDSQLNTVFVIRNLLQVSSADCTRLVSSHGNPSEWGTFCPQCSTLVRDAQCVAIIIKRSLTKLKCIRKRVINKLLTGSITVSCGTNCEKNSRGSEKRVSKTQKVRHELRNIVHHHNKCKQKKVRGVKSIESEESAIHEKVDISSSDQFFEVQSDNRPRKRARQNLKKGGKPICRESPKCDICSKAFLNKIQLFNHRRVDHQVYELLPKTPTHICDQCGKTFTSSMRLKKHIQIVHQQIFKFTCTNCKMGHADKSSYDRHMLSHTSSSICKNYFNYVTFKWVMH